jgi:hypothetical protein
LISHAIFSGDAAVWKLYVSIPEKAIVGKRRSSDASELLRIKSNLYFLPDSGIGAAANEIQ